jgi:hypothetical protein
MSTATAPVVTPSPVATHVPPSLEVLQQTTYRDAMAQRKLGGDDLLNRDAICVLVSTNSITTEQALCLMDTPKAKRVTTPIGNKLSAAVSQKGAISIYGLGRLPVTLYAEQLAKLLDDAVVTNLLQFAVDHVSELSVRPPKKA